MRIIHVLFFFVLSVGVVFGQTLKGVVVDAESGTPLPYVNIGVTGKNMGVISRDDGSFEIDLSKASGGDKLVFSMIGYESVTLSVGSLGTGSKEVKLKKTTYKLDEVVVTDKKQKPEKLGRSKASKTTTGHSNTSNFGYGGEWGLKISPKGKKYWVDKVAFHLRFNTLDSILFRVKLYSIKEGLPAESLLKKEYYVKSYKNKHWIMADISAENLIIDQDIIATFEVLQLWYSARGDNEIFFTHGVGYEEGRTFSRGSSQDQWQIDARPPMAMYIEVIAY